MSLLTDLRTYLLADSNIKAQVGGSDGRIYPLILPQHPTLPAITLFEVSARRHHASPNGSLGVCTARIQIDAWAASHLESDALAELIRKRLDNFDGVMGATTVQAIFIENSRQFYESEPEAHRVMRDFLVVHEEATS